MIIDERIASLKEEVEIATNVRLNPLYIADRRDEIQFLQWTTRLIESNLDRDDEQQEKLGETKQRQELAANRNFNQAKQLRDELCDIHDMESEISAHMQKQQR
jgi:hypothetical protein